MDDGTVMEVTYKKGFVDATARGVATDVIELHLAKPRRVETAQLYQFIGDVNDADLKRIGEDLLCDPVVQDVRATDARVTDLRATTTVKTGQALVIDVWYKSGVTDVIGESVHKGVRDLEIDGVKAVRTGLRYRFWGLRGLPDADKIARTLLFNPLVHERIIHVD